MTPHDRLCQAARMRERKRTRTGSWLQYLGDIPAGAPCPPDVGDGYAPRDGWWTRWVYDTPTPQARGLVWRSGRWQYGRRATAQEIRDYLSACVRLGLLTHGVACEVQEFVCG